LLASHILRAAIALDKSPYQQDKDCTHGATNETGSLTSLIPANSLSKVGRDQGPGNSEGCSENETLGLILATGHDKFGNHADHKADNNGPENAEHVLTHT
jgi:hypothetical protein